MDENNRELFQQRWGRLKQDLDEARDDRTLPLFRFSLGSFLIGTVMAGAVLGYLGRMGILPVLGLLVISIVVGSVCGLCVHWVICLLVTWGSQRARHRLRSRQK